MKTRTLFLALWAYSGHLLAQGVVPTDIQATPSETIAKTPEVVAVVTPSSGVNHSITTAATESPAVVKSKETLSVDFPDEEIRTILRNVADLFELNLVVPDTLQGRTSLKLREVTWRQIFQVILSPVGYAFVEDGNIIKIVTKDSLASEPFTTGSIVLENVAAVSIEPLLRSILTPGIAATATQAAVKGGSISVNTLANELVITDQASVVAQVKSRAKLLDLEPRQVIIETKFVELTKGKDKELALSLAGKNTFGSGDGAAAGAMNTLGSTLGNTIATGTPSAAGVGTFNAVLNSKQYSVLLKAFDSVSGTRIVSNPTIVAINGSTSTINIGTDYQLVTATQTTAASSSTSSVVTYTAGDKVFEGVKVDVTPQITSNKLVTLALKTEKSNATAFTVGSGATAQKFYDISKRQGSLNMILKDGQTAAIGGLMDTKNTKTETKVPIVGDIPILGNLFKSKSDSKVETNLIIFITASILEPSQTTYRNFATPDQINNLDITDRDIQGVNYKIGEGELKLYSAVNAARNKKQDQEIADKLEAEKALKEKVTVPAKN